MYNFENLKAWQESMKLSEMCYLLIKKMPSDEKFALSDQLKRAVTSVCLNIAEGSSSKNGKIFASFLGIAIGSLFETIAVLKLVERLFRIDCNKELEQCDLANKLLHGLLKSIKSDN